MVVRSSNTRFYEILDPLPLEQIGWYAKVLAESDYSTIIAEVSRFQTLEFLKELSGFGGFKVAIDKDDRIWSDTLPAGQTTRLVDQQAIWNIYEDGILRGSFFAEDVEEDIVVEGLRSTVVTGRGIGSCLEWSTVLPYGYPTYTGLERTFTGSLMSIWRALFLEAQARGELSFVNLTFTGTEASTGDPWTDSSTVVVQSGDNLLQLLIQWCEQLNMRWEMLPGFNLWVSDVNGNHLENEVLFPLGAQQRTQKRKRTRRDIANSLYVVGADNAIATAADSASIAKWRKRSRWVQAGSASDSNARNQIGLATLGLLKDQKIGHEVRVDPHGPNRRVLVDYDVADWIQIEVEEDDQSDGILQVLAITLKVDNDGDVDLDLSVGTKWDARSVALQKLLDKLGGQQVAGSASSTPLAPSAAISSTVLGDLKDVDLTPPPSDGDTLTWNSAASKWEPAPIIAPVVQIWDVGFRDGAGTWTNMPAAETLLYGDGGTIFRLDLTDFNEVRLGLNMLGTAGNTGSKIILKYATGYTFTIGSYFNIGTSEVSCALTTLNSYQQSAWIPLAAGAKADVYVAVMGINGNGTIDPILGAIRAQFRV